jgi:hypothetical protein
VIRHVDEELLQVFRGIAGKAMTHEEWAANESDDMFQTSSYCGGFDADEMEFCFSYFDPAGQEFWFQLPLDEVERIASAGAGEVVLREAE